MRSRCIAAVGAVAVLLCAVPATAQEYYIPAAANAEGAEQTRWRTDLELRAAGSAAASCRVDLLVSDQDNSDPAHHEFSLDAGTAGRSNDLLGSVFELTGTGALRVTVTEGRMQIQSRTYNDDPDGTYGQLIPAFAVADAVGAGERVALIQLTSTDRYRTNVGFVNVTAASLTVEVELHRADGTLLGTVTRELEPHAHHQVNGVFDEAHAGAVDDGFALVRTPTAGGRFFAYASVVDNDSGDAIFIPSQPDPGQAPGHGGVTADHWAAMAFDDIPASAFDQARAAFPHVYYGHTSHGSQVVTGLQMLADESSTHAMPLFTEEYGDLGHDGDLTWVDQTRAALAANPGAYSMVMWSWCGGVSDNTPQGVDAYLQAMDQLEADFPDIVFVYMTGHLDGTGPDGNLYERNDQIRDWCATHDKVLFDFADVESYDPDGAYYPWGSDWCEWCETWCQQHSCPTCDDCAHSQCVNCHQKGRAFWWMLARLAGWEG